ncbi:MAG: BspA family leucine-rich repeat surface protein, partial [Lacibacter sp.]
AAVINMSGMFASASSFDNGGNNSIDSWNTAAVTDMTFMLSQASVFNQSIGSWTFNPGVDLNNMLDNSGMDCNNYSATLIGWSANPSTPDNRNLGAAGMEYGTNAVTARTNLTGAKGWTITGDAPSGSSCSVILPVTWLYVNGQLQNGNAIIKWATASESNTRHFEIEHSSNGISYLKVGSVAAAGNSSLTERYEFLHHSPVPGKNYYRIKQIDLDDRFSYSSIVSVTKTTEENKIVIMPNPAQNHITLFLTKPNSNTQVRVINQQGQVLLQQNLQPGTMQQSISISTLPAGIYNVLLIMNGEVKTIRFVKQ